MPWTICIPRHKDRTKFYPIQHCFNVPILIDPNWWHIPRGKVPAFVTYADFSAEDARVLQVLATIDTIAEELPSEASRDIHRSVASFMQSLGEKLGAGVELSRHGPSTSDHPGTTDASAAP